MVIAMASAAVWLAASTVYDCTVDAPRVLGGTAGQEQTTEIGLPEAGPWRFQINVAEQSDGSAIAEVRWPSNPLQMAGRFPVIPTAPTALAFVTVSGGPCLFTENACLTLVHIVDETPQRSRVVMTPTALSRSENGDREPLRILLSGTCARSESNR